MSVAILTCIACSNVHQLALSHGTHSDHNVELLHAHKPEHVALANW